MFMVMSRIWAAPPQRAKIHVWRCFGSSDRLLNLGIGPLTPPRPLRYPFQGRSLGCLRTRAMALLKSSLYQISYIVLKAEIR